MHSSILIDPRVMARGQRRRHARLQRLWQGVKAAIAARRARAQRRRSMGFLALRDDTRLLRDIGLDRADLETLLRDPEPPQDPARTHRSEC
ncbi:hypothetical protein DL237_09255 [Pseudooceanicola sediminis]|uniref:DUF1127 domain-containing protein n=1 Tax=Pseudooceanicola sediminis TaxID=2211117 RepID=A0A399J0B0_9RHOB|nr:hypothetical protein [Pseudooceanicola sediminis]KAA2315055.1 hypothetical protein E0K93_08400 [Puniceibacterium sp. HSS470]RII38868.1 hypothetical protein DL237_09255 [Pseudooceanicola sediminis]|tara:strand:+ start:59809 stop:60081 length:273 start_codon:yes stop_codon:yes gene_type:complete